MGVINMKKLLSLILSFSLIFAFASCAPATTLPISTIAEVTLSPTTTTTAPATTTIQPTTSPRGSTENLLFNSFDFYSVADMVDTMSGDSFDGYSIDDIISYVEETRNGNGLFGKLISDIRNNSFYVPAHAGREISYRNIEGLSNVALLPCELYENPWIWYFPEREQSGITRISIMPLSADMSTNHNDISQFISNIAPNAPNINNSEGYARIYVSELQLSERSVNALISEPINDSRTNVCFVYDDVLVLTTLTNIEVAYNWLRNFSLMYTAH